MKNALNFCEMVGDAVVDLASDFGAMARDDPLFVAFSVASGLIVSMSFAVVILLVLSL